MIKFIDNFLNQITMYRLILYYLIFLLAIAAGFSFLGILPYNPLLLIFSALFITLACWVMNRAAAYVFAAPTNVESVYITALILALIITPATRFGDIQFLFLAYSASAIAMISKYILAIGKKHLFNPAAIAVVGTALLINQSASWWIGTAAMAPFVIIGGLLMTKKLIRFDLVMSFILVALAGIVGSHLAGSPAHLVSIIDRTLLSSSLLFFAFVMLTEPLTTPPTAKLRITYGALVGFLFVPALHFGSFYLTPELALVLGNVFSYLVSPKEKFFLTLKKIKPISADCYDFIFTAKQKFNFESGQYLEWTLPHPHPDNRGNRRYFTVASAPDDNTLSVGVKFYPRSSTFKKTLLAMQPGDQIVASQRAGDFVLPKNKKQKMVFIAGGIGITPFHSMIMHLLNRLERRPIIMFYASRTKEDFAYTKDFDAAEVELGIKTVYCISNKQSIPPDWKGERGYMNGQMIQKYVPDYAERVFYLSGPHTMVASFEETLKNMGVSARHIKKDFFPGLA